MVSFIRRDYPRQGLEGFARPSVVVVYSLIHDEQTNSTITAAPEGVRIGGAYWPALSIEDCVVLEEQLARARVVAGVLADTPLKPPTEEYIDRILGPIPFEEDLRA